MLAMLKAGSQLSARSVLPSKRAVAGLRLRGNVPLRHAEHLKPTMNFRTVAERSSGDRSGHGSAIPDRPSHPLDSGESPWCKESSSGRGCRSAWLVASGRRPTRPARRRELRQRTKMPARDQQYLERPGRPPRTRATKCAFFKNDSLPAALSAVM